MGKKLLGLEEELISIFLLRRRGRFLHSRSPDLFLLFCGLLVDLQNRNFFLAHERFWQSRPLAPSIHYINKAKGLWNKNGHSSLASPTIHKIIEARATPRIIAVPLLRSVKMETATFQSLSIPSFRRGSGSFLKWIYTVYERIWRPAAAA